MVVSPLHLTLDLSTSEGSNVSLLMGLTVNLEIVRKKVIVCEVEKGIKL